MIWIKTDIGRAEISMRSLVRERARRTLLLLIDGHRSQELLLNSIAGITAADFGLLAQLGLISRVDAANMAVAGDTHREMDVVIDKRSTPDYAQLTARLTHLISSELGLSGFRLTLAVEKAADAAALLPVSDRVIADIAQRQGTAASSKARQLIFSD